MIKLSQFFNYIKDLFGLTIWGTSSEVKVYGIRFMFPGDSECNNDLDLLYIGSFLEKDKFSPDFYNNHKVLLVGAPEMNPVNVSTFYISETIDLDKIFNSYQNFRAEYDRFFLYKEKLFETLYKGGEIEDILKLAYKTIENPVTLNDSSFTQIDCYPEGSDDFDHFEEVDGRIILRTTYLQHMADWNILKELESSSSPFVTKIKGSDFNWIFSGIKIGNSLIAFICVRCMEKKHSQFDLDYIDIVSKVVSIILQRQEFYRNPTGLSAEYFLTSLLENRYKEKTYIQQRLNSFGIKNDCFNHIIVCCNINSLKQTSTNKLVVEQLKSIFPGSLITTFQGNIILLLQTENSEPFNEAREKRILAFLKFNKLYCTISLPFLDLGDTHNFYHQAFGLTEQKQFFSYDPSILKFSDYYMEYIFNEIDNPDYLKSMIHPHILAILEYDKSHNSEYLKTLNVYLNNNRNAADSSMLLNIHRSTFFYRLKRIVDLFGFREEDSNLLFSYEFSLRILSYLRGIEFIYGDF